MKKRIGNVALGVSGSILIVLTTAIYFLLSPEKSGASWISFCFLLVSELVMISVFFMLLNRSSYSTSTLITAGSTTIVSLYWFIVLFLAVLSNIAHYNSGVMWAVELLLIGATFILLIVLTTLGNKFNESEKDAQYAGQLIVMCEQKLFVLKSSHSNSEYEKPLNDLYEDFKYGDNGESNHLDSLILDEIEVLETLFDTKETTNEMILEVIDHISSLMVKRKSELMVTRRGSY